MGLNTKSVARSTPPSLSSLLQRVEVQFTVCGEDSKGWLCHSVHGGVCIQAVRSY